MSPKDFAKVSLISIRNSNWFRHYGQSKGGDDFAIRPCSRNRGAILKVEVQIISACAWFLEEEVGQQSAMKQESVKFTINEIFHSV